MPELHKENIFEKEIVEYLAKNNWLEGDHSRYDREKAIYSEDLVWWLREVNKSDWQKLSIKSEDEKEKALIGRVCDEMNKNGSLSVLRHGFKHLNAKFHVCQFKPGSKLNQDVQDRYSKVRCRVVRQIRYSLGNEKSIDLVFFVNGIPVATAELKTDFTQNVNDAIRQYKFDREPKDPISKREEPLLAFKKRALVHFAVSSDEVYMTTELKGKDTFFLPFNKGFDEGAGNPPNPVTGYRTAYLWEEVLKKANLLKILGRFVHLEREEKKDDEGKTKVVEKLIFPRYHQLQAVNKLIDTVREEKAGEKYLIQHSAGSGKSNSIAWLAHQLSDLHDDNDGKIFDSVIVITDRTVLDDQLQETIYQFEHKAGVVRRIKKEGVKSDQLAKALIERAPIIIVTIQTFPFVLDEIRQNTSLKERKFAVIADEAHSSQTGNAAKKLKLALTAEQIEEGEEISAEDVMLATMESRVQPHNISYFAFTATPKSKTLELFGRPGETGLPEPFHLYSMQQAIEEGFILDVLKNYTPYRLAFKLAHNGREYDDAAVEKSEALKQVMRWVRLHPYNISQKVSIIVEHFKENVANQLGGLAKAMVVTASRKEAVRYKVAIDKYIRENGYAIGTLVAFSGEVIDRDSGFGPLTEGKMNSTKSNDIRETFDTDEFQVLLVANKFQTGFDQPKLVAMYVDKKLSGVTAVQTLSRLNRTFKGKNETFILDFVNSGEEILKAFRTYYKNAELSDVSDPNLIHDLQAKLDDSLIYLPSEVDAFAEAYFDSRGTQHALQAHIAPAVDRFREKQKTGKLNNDKKLLDELEIFRKDLGNFTRTYDFLSQIINYGDTELEKRSVFYRHLAPYLKGSNTKNPLDLSSVELTHYRIWDLEKRNFALGESDDDDKLKPLTEIGSAEPHDPEFAFLSEILSQMNTLFEGELTEADLLNYANHVRDKMLENETLEKQAKSNTKDQFALGDFRKVMMDNVMEGLDSYTSMATQVLNEERIREGFANILLEMVYRGFQKKE